MSRDFARATAQFRKACDLGHAEGSFGAATALYVGNGATEDRAADAVYSAKACEKGVAFSCYTLGLMYQEGDGVASPRGSYSVLAQVGGGSP